MPKISQIFLTILLAEKKLTEEWVKADFQSMEFSEWAEILLFARENVALKLNR